MTEEKGTRFRPRSFERTLVDKLSGIFFLLVRRPLSGRRRMPFGEVMYRCNAHYCFSSVFRNRVVGLVITLALMQLFLFSFYLNGLHSQVVVTASSSNNINSPVSISSEQQQKLGHGDTDLRSGSVGQVGPVGQDAFLNPSISKARAAVGGAAKKALDRLMMTKKKPAIDLMALAAKKFQDADPQDPVAKLGFNLIANAINNVKNQPVFQQQQETNSSGSPAEAEAVVVVNDVEDQTNKSQYANLAQMGLQMLTNGLAVDPTNKGSGQDVLEMASQLMWQSAKLSSKAGFDPQMAKSALALLKNAVASQKLDPKIMLTLASKMMQLQSAADPDANAPGFNLLSQLLSNGQLASALLNAGAATQPVSPAQSKTIYNNYVKIASKKLPKLKSKMPSPYSSPSGKVVVDIGFHYTLDKVKACRANASYLVVSVSSAANTEERQAARETWIKDLHQLIGQQVDVVFLIGQTANVTVQRSVEQESATYGDLIQTNVQEPVENAVFKTLSALVWIEQNCPDIQQILKMDDDVYVSAARMLKAIKEGKATPTITGSMIDNVNPHTTSGIPFCFLYSFRFFRFDSIFHLKFKVMALNRIHVFR